jgi:drug/metabolite transporter (DMT)-like permease
MAAPALTPRLLLLLALPPLLWAGNAVTGRALVEACPPVLLNGLRWSLALALLAPLAGRRWWRPSLLLPHWPWWLGTGLLGMGAYNTLQYQALHTANAVNVTLIAASLPLAMMLVGLLAFAQRPTRAQIAGSLLSLAGVLVVVSRGEPARLGALHISTGDGLMLLATLSWAGYSWLLTRRPAAYADWGWAELLAGQMALGLLISLPLAGAEQLWTAVPLQLDGRLAAALLFIALGPSLIAYRCWGLGVAEAGPPLSGMFVNLTPLFAALLSAGLLGEAAQGFHALAFGLIAAGIVVSARN